MADNASQILLNIKSFAGPIVPLATIFFLYRLVNSAAKFLDARLKPELREHFIDYILRGGPKDSAEHVLDAASSIIDLVFGKNHWSLRCFLISSLFSIITIAVYIFITFLFWYVLTFKLKNAFLSKLFDIYWSTPEKFEIGNFATWLIWSLFIDYISLYKTRLILRALRSYIFISPILCLIDFFITYIIYIIGVFLLSLLPLLLHWKFLHPPAVSLETSMALIMVTVIYGKATIPHLDAMIAAKGQLNAVTSTFLHSNAPMIMLIIIMMIQLIPFLTIGSDLFYASMFPSVWLWLFLLATIMTRTIVIIGTYFNVTLSILKRESRDFEAISTLFVPVLFAAWLSLFFWPIIIALFVEIIHIFASVLTNMIHGLQVLQAK